MIRIVWGQAAGRTAKASFDAALAEANLHQYNLRELSSVIPADVPLDVAGTAPDLGPAGTAVDAVLARQTSEPGARASAGLAWARGEDGAGVFYEVGNHDPATVAELLETGIERGCALRNIDGDRIEQQVLTAERSPNRYTTAVVVATYGEGRHLV